MRGNRADQLCAIIGALLFLSFIGAMVFNVAIPQQRHLSKIMASVHELDVWGNQANLNLLSDSRDALPQFLSTNDVAALNGQYVVWAVGPFAKTMCGAQSGESGAFIDLSSSEDLHDNFDNSRYVVVLLTTGQHTSTAGIKWSSHKPGLLGGETKSAIYDGESDAWEFDAIIFERDTKKELTRKRFDHPEFWVQVDQDVDFKPYHDLYIWLKELGLTTPSLPLGEIKGNIRSK
jgi:hypothetical protein